MQRHVLSQERIDPEIRSKVASSHRDIVDEVEAAIGIHPIVVVGMKQNPFPRRARNALKQAGQAFHYLEYGSYLNAWRRRTALKMWTGWPTFPMVFVNGTLIGGATDLQKLIESGELAKRVASGGSARTDASSKDTEVGADRYST